MAAQGTGLGPRLRPGAPITSAFRFTGLSGVKRRPALVLIVGREDLVVCAVTSRLSGRRDSVVLDGEDMSRGRLPRRSEIRPLKLFTIHRSLLRKVVGEVDSGILAEVHRVLLTEPESGRDG
ncbi:MAG TPA: type II toxin-antitoxin system PemK/MazF family toxin [Thermoplasmata archaeon]|nr:type II toxin-antitoxin system PemK/MazF family toxin [Thermoplasmata archaeon]